MIDFFMDNLLHGFACVYLLTQQAGSIAPKMWKKKELETVFSITLGNTN
jgi:hypothetical protein